MQKQFIESIPRNSLPIHVRNKFVNTEYVRVIYEPDEEANMPPEEDFTDEFIKAVEKSEEDFKAGRYVECKTKEEFDVLFKSIWNEE